MFCQCGLSGTVMSQDGHEITLFNLEVHAVHSFDQFPFTAFLIVFSVFINQILGFDHRFFFIHIYNPSCKIHRKINFLSKFRIF